MTESASQDEIVCAHVFISGIVQGVGYRFAVLDQASRLGVQGWVRNCRDRRVEALFEGNPEAVKALIRWCHNGPPAARVSDVTFTYEVPKGIEGFEIRR